LQIMRLATGQEERERVAQRVDHEADFCTQPALAAPDLLVFAVFFWAPALCWWARTMVPVDHGVFVVRIGRQHLEYFLPDAALGPT
jgi:hypothetical protein